MCFLFSLEGNLGLANIWCEILSVIVFRVCFYFLFCSILYNENAMRVTAGYELFKFI